MAEASDRRRTAVASILIGLIVIGAQLFSGYIVFGGATAGHDSLANRVNAALLLSAAVVGAVLGSLLLIANMPLLRADPGQAANIARRVAVVTRWLAVGWLVAYPVLALVVASASDRRGRFGRAIFEAFVGDLLTIIVLILSFSTVRAAEGQPLSRQPSRRRSGCRRR